MEWAPASREQKRHNVTVITLGSRYYSLCSVSSSLSHATLEQPFRTLTNKVRGKYIIVKEVLLASILRASSFLRYPSCICLYRCELFYIYMCTYVDVNLHMWLYKKSYKTKYSWHHGHTRKKGLVSHVTDSHEIREVMSSEIIEDIVKLRDDNSV